MAHPSDAQSSTGHRRSSAGRPQPPFSDRSDIGEMPSPSPMTTLGARTLHTLYAGSFVVYLADVVTDWIHTYYACRDITLTFPLMPWLAILMVASCCAGSALTMVLMFLCMENAFMSKQPLEAYRGGFLMIFEKIGSWIVEFNCFRVAFLVLILEDAPMTFINFWFISSCRIPHGDLTTWPLFVSIAGTLVSLFWRVLMLFFSYKHYWFFQLNKNQLEHINAESSTAEEFRSIIGLNEDRLIQYDECWPVRYSIFKTYKKSNAARSASGQFNNETSAPQLTVVRIRSENDKPEVETLESSQHSSMSRTIAGQTVKAFSCCCMCWMLYIGMCFSACVPCICHYTCKRNALYHRHRFARSCTKVCSTGYSIFILLFSFVVTLTLLIVNCMWLSSVQVFGHNTLPPEMSQICVQIDIKTKTINPVLLPKFRISANWSQQFKCKPIFEYRDSWGFAWNRKRPTAWKVVKIFDRKFATTWIDVDIDPIDMDRPVIYYDFKFESLEKCEKLEQSAWKMSDMELKLPWPYFRGCHKRYESIRVHRLSCNNTDKTNILEMIKQQKEQNFQFRYHKIS